ncbi:ubiquitin carboxyl-terminal hydrolase 7-like [Triticum dicoccoides]|uniref:ubiquitin carboxyl-terminal hydrolase 7-like n=1 Tax=Triticum dicoccoides TaxID=85692 RepID=UPI00188F5695|nr:ubiquitin carboxyl-terminal hydrolase 7-like [Triticum dicoccoides]
MLLTAHPQFSERHEGAYMQQDAQEFWSLFLETLSATLPSKGSEPTTDWMNKMFQIDCVTRTNCVESGETGSKPDSSYILTCTLANDIQNIQQGLKRGMRTEVTKHSPSLQRDAIHINEAYINQLPRYLTVRLPRLDWQNTAQSPIKIFQKVEFPTELDMHDLCSIELKQKIQASIQALEHSSMDVDHVDSSKPEKALTAIYDLVAVLTHQGRSALFGHYVDWVKHQSGRWIQFNDHVTSLHDESEVLSLCGGSDQDKHTAYICVYKARLV